MEHKYYSPDEIAEMLQMHPKTIRRYIREGKIKATKIGKSWRVSGHDLSIFTEGLMDADTSPQSRIEAKVSAVVDLPVIGNEAVMQMINFITSVQNNHNRAFVTLNGQYIQQENIFRMMLWGSLEGVQQLLEDIQNIIN